MPERAQHNSTSSLAHRDSVFPSLLPVLLAPQPRCCVADAILVTSPLLHATCPPQSQPLDMPLRHASSPHAASPCTSSPRDSSPPASSTSRPLTMHLFTPHDQAPLRLTTLQRMPLHHTALRTAPLRPFTSRLFAYVISVGASRPVISLSCDTHSATSASGLTASRALRARSPPGAWYFSR